MSSDAFASTFDHACSMVRICQRGLPGLETVLDALRAKARRGSTDPRYDRELFFEPWLDSQILGVPEETSEQVALELHRLTVLSLWTRLRCPEVPEDEDGTIIETDSEEELKSIKDKACPHCGTHHELVPSITQTVYAINKPKDGKVVAFEDVRLKIGKKLPNSGMTNGELQSLRCVAIVGDSKLKEQPFGIQLITALATNSEVEAVPSPRESWFDAWKGPIVLLALFFLVLIPVVRLAGPEYGWGCLLLTLLVILLVMRGITQAKLAPSAVCRMASWGGLTAAMVLFTAGTTGLQLVLARDEKAALNLMGSRVQIPLRFEFGGTNYWLIGAGLVTISLTFTFILIYDGRIGWFQR